HDDLPISAELSDALPGEVLAWAIPRWNADRIPRTRTLAEAQLR
ncbi:MAG TPA: tRNA glutamyl-Q(34) synthetase GluQRS, partial [Pseudomonas sp.]|nr:tRNA glutamyl-Q(34) synthetase GluQRS [Pseudomonas sp.]